MSELSIADSWAFCNRILVDVSFSSRRLAPRQFSRLASDWQNLSWLTRFGVGREFAPQSAALKEGKLL